MALLDRIFNPLWHKIDCLESGQKSVVASVLWMHGFFRWAMYEHLVTPFEKLCAESESPSLRINSQRIVPLSSVNRERLVDESLLACLCSRRRSNLPEVWRGIDSSHIPEAVGCLALAEINTRLGRSKPDTLDQTEYSRDPEEARTQLLLKWMKLLNLRDANFVGVVTAAFFAQEWEDCTDGLVGGAFKTILRHPSAIFERRVRSHCRALSPRGRAVMEYFVERVSDGACRLKLNDSPQNDESVGDLHVHRTSDIQARLREIDTISDKKRLARIAVSDPSAMVRERAQRAMGLDVDSMLANVIDKVQDADGPDMQMCVMVAGTLGWAVVPALKALYDEHPDPKVRQFASLALRMFERGDMGEPPSEP